MPADALPDSGASRPEPPPVVWPPPPKTPAPAPAAEFVSEEYKQINSCLGWSLLLPIGGCAAYALTSPYLGALVPAGVFGLLLTAALYQNGKGIMLAIRAHHLGLTVQGLCLLTSTSLFFCFLLWLHAR